MIENKTLTIKRGNDGFGSQLLSIIFGIAYARVNNFKYIHTPISNLKLVNFDEFQNIELDRANEFLNLLMDNLKIEKNVNVDIVKPFFHQEIKAEGVDLYYNNDLFNILKEAYPKEYVNPSYYENGKKNIAIHIRRGDDIVDSDKAFRYIDENFYDNLIIKLREKYTDSIIHVFSWNKIQLSDNDIIYHCSDTGQVFFDHFNSLVHADVLIVGSSSFSMSAGFFNKGTVVCSEGLFKCSDPIPNIWIENYDKMFNN